MIAGDHQLVEHIDDRAQLHVVEEEGRCPYALDGPAHGVPAHPHTEGS